MRTALPTDHSVSQGKALAHGGSPDFFYESGYEHVQRAPTALVSLDIAADIQQLEIFESTLDTHGWIDLVNPDDPTARRYALPPPAPIKLGNMVRIAFGYRTAAGAESSDIQDLWITAIEQRRTMPRGSAALRLYVEGGLRRLHRHHQPASIVHTADDYRGILSAIMSRAGLSLSVTNASSRSDTVLPKFTIDPDHTAHQAMTRALQYLTDRIYLSAGSTANMKQLVSGETADYAVENPYPNDATKHPFTALRLRSAPPPAGAVYVASLSTAPAFLSGEAVDHETADLGLAPLARLRDFTSDAISEADATADAHIVQLRFFRDDGQLTCPPITNLELLDTLTITDPYASTAAVTKRVSAITWRYRRRLPDAVYEQAISLCPAKDQDDSSGGIE